MRISIAIFEYLQNEIGCELLFSVTKDCILAVLSQNKTFKNSIPVVFSNLINSLNKLLSVFKGI